MTRAAQIVFLGPQRRAPTVLETLRSLPNVDPRAPVAIVSAGWEGREREHDEFEQHIGGRAVNLEVYHRVEEIYARDPEFREAVRERHDTMRALQGLYRGRLAHALEAARDLLVWDDDPGLIELEREAAIEAVRTLDAHHLARLRDIHREFDARCSPGDHPLIARYREQLRREIAACSVLCIAGGHVAILLNRLRIAGLFDLWDMTRPIVAWGAGAMALCERVILFHDSPPQGPGNAEILETGLAIAKNIVPLPHASERLHLEDPRRVELLARRFGPARCVALDPGTRIDWDGAAWRSAPRTRDLSPSGELVEVVG